MDNIYRVINELRALDFSKQPLDKINDLFRKAGQIGYIGVKFHPGKNIFRARMNDSDDHFFSKCQLTYKPAQFNDQFQRASFPSETMFYGSFIPEGIIKGDLDEPRAITILEASPWVRDKSTRGHKKITFSKWSVVKEINLIAVLHRTHFFDSSSYIRELINFNDSFLDSHQDKKDKSLAFMEFIASEFAKEVNENAYQYLISAAFTRFVVSQGLDGVLYPSVKVNGKGFNVALTPECADNRLDLSLVLECSAYKLKETTILDNDFHAFIKPNQSHFQFEKIVNEDHEGMASSLKKLGVNSIDELR